MYGDTSMEGQPLICSLVFCIRCFVYNLQVVISCFLSRALDATFIWTYTLKVLNIFAVFLKYLEERGMRSSMKPASNSSFTVFTCSKINWPNAECCFFYTYVYIQVTIHRSKICNVSFNRTLSRRTNMIHQIHF